MPIMRPRVDASGALSHTSSEVLKDQSQHEAGKGCPQIVAGVNHLALLDEIHDDAHNGNQEREDHANDAGFLGGLIVVLFHVVKSLVMNIS